MKVVRGLLPSRLYGQILKSVPICTVDVLFFNKNLTKTLLFKRTNLPYRGQYYSAGGRLFKNEDLRAGALRQAKRELGLKLNPKKLIYGGVINEINPSSVYKNINYHAVNICWGYILVKENIVLDDQHSAVKWFKMSDKRIHHYVRDKIKLLLPQL